MKNIYVQRFMELFGEKPTHAIFAPGRVNLIGEHTDYNEGWVLPAALPMGTAVTARKRSDRVLHVVTRQLESEDHAELDHLLPYAGPRWTIYVRGLASLLCDLGCEVPGADILIDGDLPIGSGLSSSSSLEVAITATLAGLSNFNLDLQLLATLGQRVENEVLGIQSGIMDQLTSVFGVSSKVLLIDCRTLAIQPVPFPSEVSILILHSGVPRTLFGSALNQRRAECNSGLQKLQSVYPDLRALRDATLEQLREQTGLLDPVELRRAQHVVTENARVLKSMKALEQGNFEEFGRLMIASHHSLRNFYEVSTAELDTLVEIAMNSAPRVFGARLTGAGFGGCVVALVETSYAEKVGQQIIQEYQHAANRPGIAYLGTPSEGVHSITG